MYLSEPDPKAAHKKVFVYRCFNENEVINVVSECFDDSTEDGTLFFPSEVNTQKDCWLTLDSKDGTIGFMLAKAFNRTMLDIHPFILKGMRKYSVYAGIATLDYLHEFAPYMYKKIITQVPSCYPHIMRYAKRLGFEEEGRYKGGFTKNGERHDFVIYGLERQFKENYTDEHN